MKCCKNWNLLCVSNYCMLCVTCITVYDSLGLVWECVCHCHSLQKKYKPRKVLRMCCKATLFYKGRPIHQDYSDVNQSENKDDFRNNTC